MSDPLSVSMLLGGGLSDQVLAPHFVTLNHIFRAVRRLPFSGQCEELTFSLRIEGPLMDLPDPLTFRFLRWMGRGRMAWLEILVPRAVWDGRPDSELREFLSTRMLAAIALLASGKKRRIPDSEIEAFRQILADRLAEYRACRLLQPPPAPWELGPGCGH